MCSDPDCRGEAGSSHGLGESRSESPADLGVMGLLRISVADMR